MAIIIESLSNNVSCPTNRYEGEEGNISGRIWAEIKNTGDSEETVRWSIEVKDSDGNRIIDSGFKYVPAGQTSSLSEDAFVTALYTSAGSKTVTCSGVVGGSSSSNDCSFTIYPRAAMPEALRKVLESNMTSSVVDDLKNQIDNGKIMFDPPADTSTRLRRELLGENSGTKVTANLQSLVLELSKLTNTHIRISSLVRTSGHHGEGRAVDLGNEEIAGHLLPQVATDAKVASLKIDELIFDAAVAGKANRNEWNYDEGAKHDYGTTTLDNHKDHIHFSVKP